MWQGSRNLGYHLRPANPKRQKVGKQALEALCPHASKLSTHRKLEHVDLNSQRHIAHLWFLHYVFLSVSGNFVLQKLLDFASANRGETVHGDCGFTAIVRSICRDNGLVGASQDQRGTFAIQKMVKLFRHCTSGLRLVRYNKMSYRSSFA